MWLHLLQQFLHFDLLTVQWKNHICVNAFYPNPSWPWTWPSPRPSCRPRTAAPARLPGEKFGSEKLEKVGFGGNKETTRGNKEKLFPACLSHFLLWRKFWGRNSFDCSLAELGKLTKQRTVFIDKKWKRYDTNWHNLERYLEHEVWIEVQKLLFQGLPTSYFSTVKGTDQWPRNIRHGIWNILWKTQPYNFYILQARSKCCHPYSLNIIQFIPMNIDNSSIKCRFFVSGSGKQIQYSAFYTFTASGVIGSISDRSKSTIFQQEARYCYDLLIYQLN